MASDTSRIGKQAASRVRIGKLIEKAIEEIENKLADQEVKMSLTDCLRVMQLKKELEDEQPAEVKVTWVDPKPKQKPKSNSSSNSKSKSKSKSKKDT